MQYVINSLSFLFVSRFYFIIYFKLLLSSQPRTFHLPNPCRLEPLKQYSWHDSKVELGNYHSSHSRIELNKRERNCHIRSSNIALRVIGLGFLTKVPLEK